MVLAHTFKAIIYIEFIFVCGVRWSQGSFSPHIYSVVPVPFVENAKSLPCFLTFTVCDDNSAIICIIVPLYVISFFLSMLSIFCHYVWFS